MMWNIIGKEYLAYFAQTFASSAVKIKTLIIQSIVVIIVTSLNVSVSGQITKLSEVIITIAEELAADESEPEEAAAYAERLYELAENPVNINSGNEEELSRLFFLSEFQVKALTDYYLTTGKIISYNEIALIPGFDRSVAEIMMPFCTLSGQEPLKRDSIRLRNQIITNLSLKTGRHDSTSPGSDLKIVTKYKFRAGSFSGGLTFEKDAGEKFLTPGTISPDFISGNLSYSGQGHVRKVIIGDYSARFGQGVNINTGINTALSLTSPGFMAAGNELKAYTSTDENIFFRGIATTLAFEKLDVSFFYSKHDIDATLGSSAGSAEKYIESFYRSGTHNTFNLLQKKDATTESVHGLNLSYNFRNLRAGLLWSGNGFSLPVIPDDNPEKIFSFRGSRNEVISLYYNCLIRKILLYGELAANDLKKYSIIHGMSVRPSDRLVINMLFSNSSEGFVSFHGKSPGRSSANYSERGIMGNFTFEAAKHLFISCGAEIRYYPWLRYRCSSPSQGSRRDVRIKYLPSGKLSIDGLFSYRLTMSDSTGTTVIPGLKQTISRNIKLSVKYSMSDNLMFGTRADFRVVSPSGSRGVLLLQDINYNPRSIPVSFWLRYCIFSTDDYDSRLYTWENDLLYTFSIPALYESGSRFYLMTGWRISDRAELRFKYGILTKDGNTSEITDTEEFRIQLKLII